jgi:general secretion pathway protein K
MQARRHPAPTSVRAARRSVRARGGFVRPLGRSSAPAEARRGFALLISLVALAILSVLVTDLHETTGMSFSASMAARDQLRAEYLAKSGINLTRMLIGQEKNIRPMLNPLFALLPGGRKAPQIPVWRFANMVLEPFANFDGAKENARSAGFDLDISEGLGNTGGTFEIEATAENGKISVNDPRLQDAISARTTVASPLYSLMGGLQSPNIYDPLFSQFDEKGRLNTRLDVIANIIDWWDADEQRTNYDPVMGTVTTSGGEDADYYRDQVEPYTIKNAPFDTLEELRLVRGVGDDFWATFVDPDPEDSTARQLTIYGGGRINPNEAHPRVLLARVCTFPEFREQLLCNDPLEQGKYINLFMIARTRIPGVPAFSRSGDFVNFMLGKPDSMYGQVQKPAELTGQAAYILFTPLVIPPNADKNLERQLRRMFATFANIITIESTGNVGRSKRRIKAVINIDQKWIPPPPNAGRLPPLGIFAYYRLD